MSTRVQIIQHADELIRKNGYKGFSFHDISKSVGIKTASIHYHFPTKADLGIAVVDWHLEAFIQIRDRYNDKSPVEKLEKLFSIYAKAQSENKLCIVGAMAMECATAEDTVLEKIRFFSEAMLDWVGSFLEEGQNIGVFRFGVEPQEKAMLIITNLLAAVQLSRFSGGQNLEMMTSVIRQELFNT